jgi:ribosomal protein RSM22 (predicted rRNA methylase)
MMRCKRRKRQGIPTGISRSASGLSRAACGDYTNQVQLPLEMRERVRELTATVPESELRRASVRLTEVYRGESSAKAMATRTDRLAYLAVRLPATFAAVRSVLAEASARVESFVPRTVLDLGAGPGTAVWAASEIFPSLSGAEVVERDDGLIKLGQELTTAAPHEWIRNARWNSDDLRTWTTTGKFDLVIASYAIGELGPGERTNVIRRAWGCCAGALVLVEPGTRKGFGTIAAARDQLLALGARVAAPCPHGMECPMRAAGDWCHFSVRIERTAEHRRLKQGDLGHEDEKFSYLVASRLPVNVAPNRVVRHPLRYSGHTKLQLCAAEGLKERTITRSEKDLYRKVKRADWGSSWEE